MTRKDVIESVREAIILGNNEYVKGVVASKNIANEVDGDGFTLLFYAVAGHNLDGISILANAGADCSRLSSNGDSPLHTAAILQDIDVTRRLLVCGADPNVKSSAGVSVREYAEIRECNAL